MLKRTPVGEKEPRHKIRTYGNKFKWDVTFSVYNNCKYIFQTILNFFLSFRFGTILTVLPKKVCDKNIFISTVVRLETKRETNGEQHLFFWWAPGFKLTNYLYESLCLEIGTFIVFSNSEKSDISYAWKVKFKNWWKADIAKTFSIFHNKAILTFKK